MSARCHKGTSRPLPRTGQPRNNPEVRRLKRCRPDTGSFERLGSRRRAASFFGSGCSLGHGPANRQQIDRDGSLQVLTLPFSSTTRTVRRGYRDSSEIGVPSMFDYSLELVASRPAKVGDKLVSKSFPHTITRGFVSVDDTNVAVCMLPGTELAFDQEVRCETGILFAWRLGHRVARFRQVNKGRSNAHHDALEFPDGRVVLLTQLCKGQHATVLQLPVTSPVTANKAQRHGSLVA